jgi:hypothetical protein
MTKVDAALAFQALMLENGAEIWPKDPKWINDFEPNGVFTCPSLVLKS